VHNIGLAAWEKGVVDFDVLVKETLQLLLNKDNMPLLLSCSSGVSATGVVVGCLRRMQVWTLASIFAECVLPPPSSIPQPQPCPPTIFRYRFFAGNLAQVEHEQLIEIFDPSCVSARAEQFPSWQVAVNDFIA
jgi:hypothetical protein